MSTSVSTPNEPKEVGAVCPYCAADPVIFNIFTTVADIPGGKLAIASVFCANPECRKLFNAQIVGGDPTVQQTGPRELWRPV